MHISHKLLWIFLGIVLLAVGSVSIFNFYQKTPTGSVSQISNNQATTTDPTANWKTYRNEKYGFEVRYPKTWQSEENTGIYRLPAFGLVLRDPSLPGTSMSLYPVDNPLNNGRCENQNWSQPGFPNLHQKVVCFSYSATSKNFAVDIVMMVTEASPQNSKEIEERILSTFKFTK